MKQHLIFFFMITVSILVYATEREDADAAYDQGDYAKALALYLPLAESGDGDAMGNVGNIYAYGLGVPIEYEKAISYWQKASEKHVPKPMGNIASCYMKGSCGLPKNITSAATWYLKAAEHQHVPSMITLSALYDLGMGIEKDKIHALAWAGLAASNSSNTETNSMALIQLKQVARNASDQDMQAAQTLMSNLAKVINANIELYRAESKALTHHSSGTR